MDAPNASDTARPVTFCRDHRDALYRELRDYELSSNPAMDVHTALEVARRGGDAHDVWQRMNVAARLLDDLGWDQVDDRDSYTLTMHAGLLEAWARGRRGQLEQGLADYSQRLADLREGTDPWSWAGDQLNAIEVARSVAALRSLIDQELELIAAFSAILSQLEHGD
jgi:hypothetical protein